MEFDNVYVSFSGGKDSGVLLNMCIDYIRQNNLDRKLGVFHMDYEAQYSMTTEYVDRVLAQNRDILEVYRVCVPFKVVTCASMYQNYWRPWDESMNVIHGRIFLFIGQICGIMNFRCGFLYGFMKKRMPCVPVAWSEYVRRKVLIDGEAYTTKKNFGVITGGDGPVKCTMMFLMPILFMTGVRPIYG